MILILKITRKIWYVQIMLIWYETRPIWVFFIWKKPLGLKWKTPTENATTKNMLVQLQNDPPRKIEWQKFIDNNENPSTRLKN